MPVSFSLFRKKKSSRNGRKSSDMTSIGSSFPVKEQASHCVKMAKKFAQGLQRHDVEMAFSTTASNCVMRFKGEEIEYTIKQFKQDCVILFASFPDLAVTWESMLELSPGKVIIENWQVSGTHTGTPYSFGPFKEIQAKGIFCKNDFERFTLFFTDGLISKIEVEALGPSTGPPGFYQQIGGLILW